LGFLDATYLTVEHYLGSTVPCSITQGCERVLISPHATVGMIPVALFGAIYYAVIFLLSVASIYRQRAVLLVIAANLARLGFIASLYFVYLQFFVLRAICIYCMVSAAISTVLLILGFWVIKNYNER
jgi:uncharacterized membrane protein